MILGKDFINKIMNCQWLQMCGIKEDFEYDIEYNFFERMLRIYLSGHLPCGWENIQKVDF